MLKLASLVQYVPLPVIGGYLAFVGYFCLAAGVSLASGVHIDEDPMTWAGLASADALLHLVPALLLLLLITAVQRRFSHPLALPLLLAAAPVVFYVVLAAGGWTLAEAQQDGWVTKPTVSRTIAWGCISTHITTGKGMACHEIRRGDS